MNKSVRSLCGAAACAAALLAANAVPANAAAGDTTTTFTLSGGALSVSVQPNAALNNGVSGQATVTGLLGTVLVTDARGGKVAWSAFAKSTVFTGSNGSTSTGDSYNAGVITTTGIVTMPPAVDTPLSLTAAKVVGPSVVVGNNTAKWNPTLTVTLPSEALAGDYTGTINTSVS